MLVIHTIAELRAHLDEHRQNRRKISLVPTMGFLHQGHMALAQKAREESDVVVLSIFVNPIQFGVNEDLDVYPRDLPHDIALCKENGVDIIFAPSVAEIYPEPIMTSVEVQSLSNILIGRHRPNHFRGVTTIVAKLLNIVEPDKIIFGEKDYQQLIIVRRMIRDLSYKAEVVGVPIVREEDGLACSSRNARLTKEDRAAAVILSQSLKKAQKRILEGEKDVSTIRQLIEDNIKSEARAKIQSIDICHATKLDTLDRIDNQPIVILLAVAFGDVVLIDQQLVTPNEKAL